MLRLTDDFLSDDDILKKVKCKAREIHHHFAQEEGYSILPANQCQYFILLQKWIEFYLSTEYRPTVNMGVNGSIVIHGIKQFYLGLGREVVFEAIWKSAKML